MTSRRKFLKVLGGGVILAAAGTTERALTRDPSSARAPWASAGAAEDVRHKALSYAILAPNPHNRQPWLVDLGAADEITLYCDDTRKLVHTDPFDRQVTVGLGAFLELLSMAFAAQGIKADISLFPQGEPQPRLDGRPVALVRLNKNMGVAADPLFDHVLARRTNRLAYDTTRPVAAALLAEVAATARTARIGYTEDPEEVAGLRDICWRGLLVEFTNPETMQESVDLMRVGRRQIEANQDGISLAGPMMEALSVTGLFNPEELVDPNSPSFQRQMPFLKASFDSAMACMWVVSAGNTRGDQIQAGRDYVRLNLAATSAGLAMQPWSRTLQEFSVMTELAREIRAALGIAPQEGLQMFVRLGYVDTLPPSPRWPYESRILSS